MGFTRGRGLSDKKAWIVVSSIPSHPFSTTATATKTTMTFAPFTPPPADLPGKPVVPEWIPPATTKTEQEWAKLRTLDLSLVNSEDPEVKRNLTEVTKKAIREDGFLFVENYGVSLEQASRVTLSTCSDADVTKVHRQFAIGKYMFTNMSDEDKERLLFRPEERGTWEGYKHPYGFKASLFYNDFSCRTDSSAARSRPGRRVRAVQLVPT